MYSSQLVRVLQVPALEFEPVFCRAGNARLALKVHKCRMQYRGIMEKPFFTLSVRGRGGSLLEPNQDTSPGIYANGVVSADHTLVLTTPIAQIPQGSLCMLCCAADFVTMLCCLFSVVLCCVGMSRVMLLLCPVAVMVCPCVGCNGLHRAVADC